MARVRYGAYIIEIKGKIGGQVFQGGHSGPIIRNNYQGSDRRNFLGEPANITMALLAQEWKNLDNSQRIAWSNLSYNFPVSDKWGDAFILSGYSCFQHLNFINAGNDMPIITDIPTPQGAPDMFTITGTCSVGSMELILTWDPSPIDGDRALVCDLFYPNNTGIVDNIRTRRRLRKLQKESEGPTWNGYTDYDEQMYGPLRVANIGKYVPVVYFTINTKTGERSSNQYLFIEIES